MKLLLASIALIFTTSLTYSDIEERLKELEDAQLRGSISDSRDGQTYTWVKIGRQRWLVENVNYSPTGDPWLDQSSGVYHGEGQYSREFNGSIRAGLYYTWAAAMDGAASSTTNPSFVRGQCPAGFHVPSDLEWSELAKYVDSSQSMTGIIQLGDRDDWTDVGYILRSVLGWGEENGVDIYGFKALPTGVVYPSGVFALGGTAAKFWSTTEKTSTHIWARGLGAGWNALGRHAGEKNSARSLRCLQIIR